ncbi:MAG: hypothetical protein LBI26_02280 [Holosporales bacterium]|nr:hypothetical protein [Holosporales bacterium]
MNEQESNLIKNFLEHKKSPKKENLKQKKMEITGIFFLDKETWTVWIDNVSYSSIGQKQNFSIDDVNENEVTITMKDGETFILSVESVIEKKS